VLYEDSGDLAPGNVRTAAALDIDVVWPLDAGVDPAAVEAVDDGQRNGLGD